MKRIAYPVWTILLFALLSPLWFAPSAATLAAPSKIVEQWRGTMRAREANDVTAHSSPYKGDTGMEYLDWENRIELNVDEAGNVSGFVNSKVTRWAFQSDPGKCFVGPQQYFTNCWLTYEVVGPYSSFSVSGKRGLDA